MLNIIALMGRITRDPETRVTQSGKTVCTFSIAVDRDYDRDTTDFIDIVAWGNSAEFASKYFTKGMLITCLGSLQIRNWEDKEGHKRRNAEVVANHLYFAERKQTTEAQKFEPITADEELPF